MSVSLDAQLEQARAELADIKRILATHVMVPRSEYEQQRALFLNEAADEAERFAAGLIEEIALGAFARHLRQLAKAPGAQAVSKR